MSTTEKKTNKKKPGIVETTFGLTVGEAVLAADKAASAVDDAIERGGKAVKRAGVEIEKKARQLVDRGESAAETAARRAQGATRRVTRSTTRDHTTYENRTKDELYRVAAEREIEGRSRMTKDELIEALRAS